jgi:hypothetical protein
MEARQRRFAWRSGKRTSLRQVKSLDMLRKRVNVLLSWCADKVIIITIIAVRNACKRSWQDSERIEVWAHGGWVSPVSPVMPRLLPVLAPTSNGTFQCWSSLGTTSDGTGSSCGRARFNCPQPILDLKPSFPLPRT